MTRAGIYTRISEDPDGDELGVTRQETHCREVAERRGWPVVEVCSDDDLSATHGDERPAYGALMAAVARREIDVIIVYHLSRLWRNRRERADGIEHLKRHAVSIVSARGPDLDLSSAYGRAMAGLLGEFDTMESEVKAERVTAKHLELARAGKVSGGGTRPFGYADDRLTIVPAEAELVREAARRVLAGEAVVGVARDWNGRGIRTPASNQWSVMSLKRMLVSARISGRREHRPRSRHDTKRPLVGEIVADAVWPPIVTVAESDKLRLLLTDPERRVTPGATGRYPLTRLLYCSRCGHWMVGRPRDDGRRRYVCDGQPGRPGCGKTFTLADPVEELIRVWMADAWASDDFRAAIRRLDEGPDDEDLVRRIGEEQAALDQLADDHGRNRITRSEWFAARAPIQDRIAQLRRLLTRPDHSRILAEIPADFEAIHEATADPIRLRTWASAALERVTVHPAVRGRNTFDAGRFDPTWRV